MNRFSNFAFNGGSVYRKNSQEDDSPGWLDVRRPGSVTLQDKQRTETVANDAVRRIPKKRPLPNDESDNETGRSPRRRYDTSFPNFTMEDMLNKTKSESLEEILRRKPSPKSKLVRTSLMEKSLEELQDYDPLAEKRAKAVDMLVKERAARVHSRAASTLFDGEEEAAPQFSAKNRKKRIVLDDSDDEEEAFNVKPTNGKSNHGNGSKSKINLEDEGDDDQFVVELIDTPVTKQKSNKSKIVDTQPAESSKRRKDDRTVFNLVDETELQDALDEDAVGANSDEEDGHDWDEDMTSAQIVAKAHAVIRQCEAVSKNLRKSLLAWQQPNTAASNPAQSSKVKDGVVDCVNLVSIASPEANKHHSVTATITNQALLNNEDIAVFCPGLLLNPYQLVGVNWLKLLYENEVNGVLADDMGLGKTVQSIAFMGWLSVVAQNTPRVRRPHLIVVPASVLSNWENELERFCPSLTVLRYHGSQNEKSLLRQELRRRIPLGEIDVILTTYTLFERESNAKDRAFFMNQKFNFLILDEAHSIKNASSSRYNNLNALNTKHRLLLSGTPVQNDLRELLALLSFLMPRVFDRENCEAMVMAFDWDLNGKNQESNKVVAGVSLSQLKSMLAPFVLRRLKRDVLDHLSDKTTEVVLLPPAPAQKSVYEETIFSYAQRKERSAVRAQEAEVEARLSEGKLPSSRKRLANSGKDSTEKVEKDSSGSTSANAMPSIEKWLQTPSRPSNISDGNGAIIDLLSPEIDQDLTITDPAEDLVQPLTTAHSLQNTALAQELRNLSSTDAKHLFTALRKVANHPLLLRIRYQDEELFEKISRVVYNEGYFGFQVDYARAKAELETFSDFDIHQLCLQYEYQLGKYALDSTALYDSPKMDHLRTLLPQLQDEGHRMLIFSQWTRLLDLLEVLLQDMGMDFLRLDGSTPIKERQERIDLFNADTSISVFLLSTKAGGLGINLTSADTVILHDLDFNPENDKQAEDRCHRIGQTKPVTVYKLVTQGTVDEDIYEMGERKRQLSQAVLSDNSKGKVVDVDDEEETTNGKNGKKKGGAKKKGKGDDDDGGGEEDLDAISRILSRALLRQGIQL